MENRICQNIASIQLNGGLNNDQAKGSSNTNTTPAGVGGGGGGGGGGVVAATVSAAGGGVAGVASGGAGGGVGGVIAVAPVGAIAVDNTDAESQLAAVAAAAELPEQEGYSLLTYPKGTSCFAQFTWLIIWPIHLLFRIAIPDCKKAKNNKIFPLTFIMCIVWIGSLSYVVAWMITIIGEYSVNASLSLSLTLSRFSSGDTLKIPDSVMGITFLAAGTSVPEAVSSVIVAKRGELSSSYLSPSLSLSRSVWILMMMWNVLQVTDQWVSAIRLARTHSIYCSV